MIFDYSKLRGKIIEKYESQKKFASVLGVTMTSLSKKLNNRGHFTQVEIEKSAQLLDIDSAIIHEYFFAQKVQKLEQKQA